MTDANMEDRLNGMGNGEATSWDFTQNPVLHGRFIGYQNRESKFGPFKVVEIMTKTGKVDFILKHTVLKNELERNDVKAGDDVGIKYCGKHSEKGYHLYNVIVDKRSR